MSVFSRVCVSLSAAALLMSATISVRAQQYPTKPVRLIVPTSPGGGTDLVGRVIAQALSQTLGQQFVVENRGGAGSTLGNGVAAKAPADGYTLLLAQLNLAFTASYYRKLPYDTLRDFAAISLLGTQPFIVTVHPSLPVKSVKELIALAKKKPGELAYGSGGAGSGPHIGMELFRYATGVDVLHVPYRGAGPAFVDLIAGQVQLMIATRSIVLPHARDGRVRPLAITSLKRHPALSGLPTVAESGVPGYHFEAWYGLAAPAGTPAPIIQRLNEATLKVLPSGEVRERLAGDGIEATGSTPEQFAAYLRREVELCAKVVKAIGHYAD
jgi:tripartite-type tricarboxylate transporter receptor subunit TctC